MRKTISFKIMLIFIAVGAVFLALSLRPPQMATITNVVRIYEKSVSYHGSSPRTIDCMDLETDLGKISVVVQSARMPDVGDQFQAVRDLFGLHVYNPDGDRRVATACLILAAVMCFVSVRNARKQAQKPV